MAVDVHGDRSDRPVLHLVVEAVAGEQLLKLPAPFGHFEPAVLHLLEPMIAREVVGSMAGEKDVRPVLEQFARKANWRACRSKARHRSGGSASAIHDCGLELDKSLGREHAIQAR